MKRFPSPLAGVDEAGRGCLAGPVVAAAVILPDAIEFPGLTDSKKLSPSHRRQLALEIKSKSLNWAVGLSWPPEIDRINILQATLAAMNRAIACLRSPPAYILIDGISSPGCMVPHECIPRADALFPVVSAASILAKTYRDRLMIGLDKRYPGYGFKIHKGYGTQYHRDNLSRYGPCAIHRKSFKLVRDFFREKQGWLPGISV